MTLLKWIALLLFTQCFVYKDADFRFGPSFQLLGFNVTPDRLVSLIILSLAVWSFTSGKLQFSGLGKVGRYTLLLAVISTVSALVAGRGEADYYRLFDFHYNPLIIFVVAQSIPHSHRKLELVSLTFLALGTYLTINGMFERYGPHALVWPQYILDPRVGVQFGRTRGSFASSEMLGAALVVAFLFYVLYSTRVEGAKRYWTVLMTPVTIAAIYAANQRAAWLGLSACLALLTITKTHMRRVTRLLLAAGMLVFLSGVATHLSLWENTLFSKRQKTVHDRWVNNLTTLDMGIANPLFGIGYGNFKTEWPKYFDRHRDIYDDVKDLSDGNHNTFLGLFAEVGLVGLVPYLLILYHMFRMGLRVYRKSEGFEQQFSLVFLLVALSYVIGANFSDYRNAQFCNTTLFLLCGAVASIEASMTAPVHRVSVSPRSWAPMRDGTLSLRD